MIPSSGWNMRSAYSVHISNIWWIFTFFWAKKHIFCVFRTYFACISSFAGVSHSLFAHIFTAHFWGVNVGHCTPGLGPFLRFLFIPLVILGLHGRRCRVPAGGGPAPKGPPKGAAFKGSKAGAATAAAESPHARRKSGRGPAPEPRARPRRATAAMGSGVSVGWRLRCWLLFCLCSPGNGLTKARQGLRCKWRVCAIHPFLIRSAAARGSGILVGFGSHRMAVFRPSFSDSLANQYPPNFITGFVFSGYYYAFCWCWVECVPPGFVRPED